MPFATPPDYSLVEAKVKILTQRILSGETAAPSGGSWVGGGWLGEGREDGLVGGVG